GLAAQDVVVDRAVVDVQRAVAQGVERGHEHVLARLRGVVLGLDAGAYRRALLRDLAVDFIDLALQRLHGRVFGLEGLELLLVLRVQRGALLLQGVEYGVADGAGRQLAAAGNLAPRG